MSAASGSSDDPKIRARTARLGQVWEAAKALAAAQMPKQLSGSTRHSDISVETTNSVDYSSLIPLREGLVDPDVPAPSPSHRRSRSMLFTSCLVGLILAGGTSAVIAFRQFSLADIWRDQVSSWAQLHRPTLTMRGEQAIPRLIVQSSSGHSGEPMSLGLTIDGPAQGAVIIITGLLPGMELINGIEVDVDRWEVAATDLRYAWITPPDGFVGSAALTAELRLTDDSIAHRQAIHLEWVPSSPSGFAENQYNREEAAGPTPPVLAGERDLETAAAIPSSPSFAPEQRDRQDATAPSRPPVFAGERGLEKAAAIPSSPSLAPEQADRQEVTVASSPPVLAGERDLETAAAIPTSPSLAQSQFDRDEAMVPPILPRIAQKQVDRERPVAGSRLPTFAGGQLDREEVTVLLKRGKDLIASGDIAAARLILKRAADANDAEAALALAATYDPYVLRGLKVYGFAADAEMARAWYEKARVLGSSAASQRLEMLASGAR
jgi:hypothetical protein